MPRVCGTCTVCCIYLPVEQLNKPGLQPCKYLANGCTVYNNRPCGTAAEYQCLWLRGYGAEEDRPDRCGVLIDCLLKIENAIQAKPIRADASETPEGMAAIRRISKEMNRPALVAGFPSTVMVRVVGRGAE